MSQCIGCDAHRAYSIFVSLDEHGRFSRPTRVEHDRVAMARYLQTLPPKTPVAVEASGSWYWLVDALEAAGLEPHLAQPHEAHKLMGGPHKTDVLDAQGLARLLRNGTLPEVWIPSAQLRDLRGLMRARLALRRHQTAFKNRLHGALNRYGLKDQAEPADLFEGKGRVELSRYVQRLPEQTRQAALVEWRVVDELAGHIEDLEERVKEQIGSLAEVKLLKSLPGVGEILGATLALEIGQVSRFATPAHLASYAGLVPTVKSSGGHSWRGATARASNHYLKWAFVEAANVIAAHRQRWQKQQRHRHVVDLYERVKAKTGLSGKAKVAVARHLAEASWWILSKKQSYREPAPAAVSSSKNG